MSEELIIEQEFIDQAKAEMAKDPALRPCQICVRYDTCSAVRDKKVRYGAACFVTSEQALRALMLKEKKRALSQRAKLNEKLDVMNIMVSGADMIRQDILDMLESEYKRIQIKAKTDDATYQRSKKNLARLAKCYGQMKVSMQDFESAFRTFIDYWNAQMFEGENGVYGSEYDKHSYNVGFMTYVFFALYGTMYMCEENVQAFIDFVNNVPKKREDILEESDLKRYLIRI